MVTSAVPAVDGRRPRNFNVFNRAGTVNIIIDITGYYTNASLVQLADRVAALEAGLATAPINEPPAAVVVAVSITAQVDGRVTGNSTANAGEATPGDRAECSITDGTDIDFDVIRTWTSTASSLDAWLAAVDVNSSIGFSGALRPPASR